jgi:hypothetical protein
MSMAENPLQAVHDEIMAAKAAKLGRPAPVLVPLCPMVKWCGCHKPKTCKVDGRECPHPHARQCPLAAAY